MISRINFGDLANLRNPFIQGGEALLVALVAAKALYGIGNAVSCSANNFQFRSGVTNNSNLLSSWPKDSRGMVVFDFEIGVATIELFDVAVGLGLCDEKDLFK